MSAAEEYRRFGVPTTLLGLNQKAWRRTGIRLILDHYKWKYEAIIQTKINLMHELHLLVQEYDLDKKDRNQIFNAHKSGVPLPQRKSRARRVPHPAFPDSKATARGHVSRNQAKAKAKSQPAIQARKDAILESPRPEVANALPQDCVVCFETLSPQNTPKRKITSLCNHEPDVCKSCLTTSISTQFNSKVWDQIDCPTCGQRLGFQDVKTFADSLVFGRSVPKYPMNESKIDVLKQIRQSLATGMPFRRSIPALSSP